MTMIIIGISSTIAALFIGYDLYQRRKFEERFQVQQRAMQIEARQKFRETAHRLREMRLENQDWYKDFSIWLRRIGEKVDPEG